MDIPSGRKLGIPISEYSMNDFSVVQICLSIVRRDISCTDVSDRDYLACDLGAVYFVYVRCSRNRSNSMIYVSQL